MGRPRKYTPEEANEADTRRKKRWYIKNKIEQNRRRQVARARATKEDLLTRARLGDLNTHITTPQHLDHPRLLWLDQHGHLHIEEEHSAEELIRRHEKGHQ
jgi:hypothetical protein